MAGQETKKGDGGLMELLIPLAVVTVLGGGGGWFLGFSMLAPTDPAKNGTETARAAEAEKPKAAEGSAHAEKEGSDHAKPAHGEAGGHGKADAHEQDHGEEKPKPPDKPESLQVKELPAIVTNLAASKNWVRLQAAIVFDPKVLPHAETLIPELMSDLTGFLNTLEIGDVEGPDGLRRLREELNERALIRSERHVHELVIESLVIQ